MANRSAWLNDASPGAFTEGGVAMFGSFLMLLYRADVAGTPLTWPLKALHAGLDQRFPIHFCGPSFGGVNRALSSPISPSISALSFWFMADNNSSLYLGLAGLAKLSISSGSSNRS